MSSALLRGTRRFTSRHLSRHAGTLVLADHNNKELNEATLHAISAAGKFGNDVTVLVAGKDCEAATAAAKAVAGVAKVLTCNAEPYANRLAESTSVLLSKAQAAGSYSHIVATNSNFSKNIMGRLSGLLDKPLLTDVVDIQSPTKYVRPIYAGNALATFECTEDVTLLTVRQTSFDPAAAEGGSASEEALDSADAFSGTAFVSNELTQNEGPTLSAASKVVSGGRGMKNGENFEMLYTLAGKLGDCAVGASRAAVDAGFVANDMQVGQTGKVVAPDLYMAVGISGAIQHLAGMKDSKKIVCINKDPEAPIFQVSDYGLEADLFKAVPELNEKLASA